MIEPPHRVFASGGADRVECICIQTKPATLETLVLITTDRIKRLTNVFRMGAVRALTKRSGSRPPDFECRFQT